MLSLFWYSYSCFVNILWKINIRYWRLIILKMVPVAAITIHVQMKMMQWNFSINIYFAVCFLISRLPLLQHVELLLLKPSSLLICWSNFVLYLFIIVFLLQFTQYFYYAVDIFADTQYTGILIKLNHKNH